MKKPLCAGAALLVVPLVLISSTGVAGAVSQSPATTAVIQCTQIEGKITFDPPLSNAAITDEKIVISETVSGCSVTDASITVSQGVVSASVKINLVEQGYSQGCDFLGDASAFGTKSSGKIAWTSDPAVPNSTFQVDPLHSSGDNNDPMFGWSFGTVGGSFQGPNRGEYDVAWADNKKSLDSATTKCASANGLKSLSLTHPSFSPFFWLGGPNPELPVGLYFLTRAVQYQPSS